MIAKNIVQSIIKSENEYEIIDSDCNVYILWRKWLNSEDYNKLISPIDRSKIINDVLEEESKLELDDKSKLKYINKFMNIKSINNYLNNVVTNVFH